MAKEIIVAKEISRVYGDRKENGVEALKPTSLTIEEGEFVAIMGPSGAGKSTLLGILSTIDLPTTGKIFIDGQELRVYTETELANYRNNSLGFIFQDFNLLEPLTIEENIAVPLVVGKKDSKFIKEKVLEVSKICNIDWILSKHPSECSGGQRQRAAVCRGFVNDPKIIIADEPTGNLDSENSHAVLMAFSEMNKRGTCVIMVTHDAQIASYSSRALFVKDGMVTDEVLRGDLSQDEYFKELVDLSSKDTTDLFEG